MDATYSKSVRTCARAEVPRFVVLTPTLINLIINQLD